MKVLMICNTDGAMYVFRKPLLKGLVRLGHEVISITPNGPYVPRIEELGVRTRVIAFQQYSLSIWSNLILFIRIFRTLRAERPDIVHSFTHKPAILGTVAARLARTPKRFITITGLGRLFIRDDIFSRFFRVLLLLQYRIACRFATGVFFQNPDDFHFFTTRRILGREKAILTNGSGIDMQEYRVPTDRETKTAREMLARELGYSLSGLKVVLLPARALPEKGIYEFYEAAKKIRNRSSSYIFIHLGHVTDDLKSPIDSTSLRKLANSSNAHFLGFRENLTDFMAAADIVSLPSAREGMPRSLVEALAMGKCIVTTDVPGCRLAVRDGWNGFLCRHGDADSLAQAILKVSDELIHHCRERSRALCEELFSAAALVDVTFKRYFGA